MKLCKDCKHAVWPPHPLQQALGAPPYVTPMCGHPEAERSVVDGKLKTPCEWARGESGPGDKSVCWPHAKLFEQAPPKPEPEPMKPYQVVETWTPEKRTFWRRIFG